MSSPRSDHADRIIKKMEKEIRDLEAIDANKMSNMDDFVYGVYGGIEDKDKQGPEGLVTAPFNALYKLIIDKAKLLSEGNPDEQKLIQDKYEQLKKLAVEKKNELDKRKQELLAPEQQAQDKRREEKQRIEMEMLFKVFDELQAANANSDNLTPLREAIAAADKYGLSGGVFEAKQMDVPIYNYNKEYLDKVKELGELAMIKRVELENKEVDLRNAEHDRKIEEERKREEAAAQLIAATPVAATPVAAASVMKMSIFDRASDFFGDLLKSFNLLLMPQKPVPLDARNDLPGSVRFIDIPFRADKNKGLSSVIIALKFSDSSNPDELNKMGSLLKNYTGDEIKVIPQKTGDLTAFIHLASQYCPNKPIKLAEEGAHCFSSEVWSLLNNAVDRYNRVVSENAQRGGPRPGGGSGSAE